MRKGGRTPASFYDSDLYATLRKMGGGHDRVVLYLHAGRTSELSGILVVSPVEIAETLFYEPDEIRTWLGDLERLGWCMYEGRVLWIRGYGNIEDQLGRDFRRNPSDLIATLRHLESLPRDSGVVRAFREHYDILGLTAAAVSADSRASKRKRNEGPRDRDRDRDRDAKGPQWPDSGVTTGVTTGPNGDGSKLAEGAK